MEEFDDSLANLMKLGIRQFIIELWKDSKARFQEQFKVKISDADLEPIIRDLEESYPVTSMYNNTLRVYIFQEIDEILSEIAIDVYNSRDHLPY